MPTPAPAPKPSVQFEAPKFLPEGVVGRELRDLSGRAFRLSDFGGRVYVINLWATWCGPCQREIPGLNRVYEDFRERGVEFIGLTTEDSTVAAERVREFTGELRMKYRIGWLDAVTARALMSWNAAQSGSPVRYNIPQTFVMAADGHVVLHLRGYSPAVSDMVRASIQKALDLSSSQAPAPPGAAVEPLKPKL
jgi:thiol-disulfide isomerase/thioredoxin